MGVAIDTVGFVRSVTTTPDIVPATATPATGDSFSVRSFPASSEALLQDIFYTGNGAGDQIRLRSPMFHDNIRGIFFLPNKATEHFAMPPVVAQSLVSQDTFSVEAAVSVASESVVGSYSVYYKDLKGAAARLYSPGDVMGIIKSIKVVEVNVAQGTVPGVWIDALITEAEDLLHANKDYCVLGYYVDTECACVGIKGTETGNLRICGPGILDSKVTMNYFADKSTRMNLAELPVINSANKGSLYVTILSDGSDSTVRAQLVLGELEHNLQS